MRRRVSVILVAALLALSACGKDTPADDKKAGADTGPGVSLDADSIKSLGITTAPAIAARYSQQISGYGIVTALDAIAQTDADFLTAQAAVAQSQAAANRAKDLASGDDAAVSREVVETAQSKAAADQAALALASRKAEAAFGRNAPWRTASARQALMARLASGRTTLVRVTFPLGTMDAAAPASLQIARLGAGAKSWTANTVWDAPADPGIPGRGFFALVDGSDLAQNERVIATVPVGAAQNGIVVPAAALVLGESETWVYLENRPNHFLRMPIDTGKPLGDGYFLDRNAGIAAGQEIVTKGAGLLLAHEINPSSGAED
jgi:hypothetical protein